MLRVALVASLIAPQLAHADPETADRGTYRMKFTGRLLAFRTDSRRRIPDCKDDNIVPGVKSLEIRIDTGVTVNARSWMYDGRDHGRVVARTTRPGKRLEIYLERNGNGAEASLLVYQGDETSSCISAGHFAGTFAATK